MAVTKPGRIRGSPVEPRTAGGVARSRSIFGSSDRRTELVGLIEVLPLFKGAVEGFLGMGAEVFKPNPHTVGGTTNKSAGKNVALLFQVNREGKGCTELGKEAGVDEHPRGADIAGATIKPALDRAVLDAEGHAAPWRSYNSSFFLEHRGSDLL